jgi:septum formation protein
VLILASTSPRRHHILLSAGLAHVVNAVPVDETRRSDETPIDYVVRLAREKAGSVHLPEGAIVLAADTTVAIGDEIFGKPEDETDALRMLRALSGRDHWVYTGICLLSRKKTINDVAATRVTFLDLEDAEIEEYTRSGEPFDKAGAYAIQGLASKFIAGIEGCYQNVVGLPVSLVYRHLKSF